jgi:hypothetical protein
VSTDKQADRGVSLDAQRAKVNAYAELYDLELADVIVDAGKSAKSLDRPGLQRALAMLKFRTSRPAAAGCSASGTRTTPRADKKQDQLCHCL